MQTSEPPSRYEWDDHLMWSREQVTRLEGRADATAEKVDVIEARLDKYLGIAVATPWLLTMALTILLILERMRLLP